MRGVPRPGDANAASTPPQLPLKIVALSEKMRGADVIVELDEAQDMVHCYQFFSWCLSALLTASDTPGSLHSACAAGILRIAVFARKFAPGHLRLSTEQVTF
eukprot:761852-Hanusia_phi.AAC.3